MPISPVIKKVLNNMRTFSKTISLYSRIFVGSQSPFIHGHLKPFCVEFVPKNNKKALAGTQLGVTY